MLECSPSKQARAEARIEEPQAICEIVMLRRRSVAAWPTAGFASSPTPLTSITLYYKVLGTVVWLQRLQSTGPMSGRHVRSNGYVLAAPRLGASND